MGIYTHTQYTYKKYIYISLLNSNVVRYFDHQFQRTKYMRVENKMIFNLLYCFMSDRNDINVYRSYVEKYKHTNIDRSFIN